MLVWPPSRRMLMAVLRRVPMACGPPPVRFWERSSSRVTSRTQCSRFAINQCPRSQAATWARFRVGDGQRGDGLDDLGMALAGGAVGDGAPQLQDLYRAWEPNALGDLGRLERP